MANVNWARWIHASVAKYLKGIADTNAIASLVEGIEDRTDEFMEAGDRVEIRMNGPFVQEVSKGCFRFWVDINVLAFSNTGEQAKNSYRLDEILGIFQAAMDSVIAVNRYGTGPDDDDTLLGCLFPRSGRNDSIRIFHFGEIDKDTSLRQGMIDARYIMYISA